VVVVVVDVEVVVVVDVEVVVVVEPVEEPPPDPPDPDFFVPFGVVVVVVVAGGVVVVVLAGEVLCADEDGTTRCDVKRAGRGRLDCPLGPLADATAPALMVTASAPDAMARRWICRIFRTVPLRPESGTARETAAQECAPSAARRTQRVP
jgi:hypothetical protein